jgi:predicted Fe-Mo cluster-binding NifX family protein
MKNLTKIAIATENNNTCSDFEKCTSFTLVDIDLVNKKAARKETLKITEIQPLLRAQALREKKPSLVIAYTMEGSAQEYFISNNIPPLLGVLGNIDTIIQDFMHNTLELAQCNCEHSKEKQL